MQDIAFIGIGAPWQAHAGYLIRQGMFLDALRACGRVHAILFADRATSAERAPDWLESVHWIPDDVFPTNIGLGFWSDLFDPLPRLLRYRRAPEAAARVRELLDTISPERVFVYRVESVIASGLVGQAVTVDVDDPEHIRRRAEARLRGPIDPRTRVDLWKLERWERHIVRRCRRAFVCQDRDASAFHPRPLVVPNAIAIPREPPRRTPESGRVLFVGNLADRGPNLDGLEWFVERVWPLILRRQPDAVLRVVGRGAKGALHRFEAMPSVVPVGFVDDLALEYQLASLTVVPIRFGTGTRIKILEAMSRGCPVVSTAVGADGLDAVSGRDLLEADGEDALAGVVVEVLRDADLSARLGRQGRAFVETRYDRDRVIDDIRHLMTAAG